MGMLKDALLLNPEITPVLNIKITKKTCSKHGEYDSYTGDYGSSGCPSCDDVEYKKEHMEIIRESEKNKAKDIFKRSCVPPKFRRSTFADFNPSCENAKKMKEKLGMYVIKFDEALKYGVSYLISGKTDTGKTLLATAVLNNIMHRGYTGVYMNTVDFLLRIKKAWEPGNGVSVDDVIQYYVDNFDLLVLDDILKGNVTENDKAMIFSLLDRRNQMDKPTIGISIFSEKQISMKLDPDVVRRLHNGGGETLLFDWKGFEETRKKFL